MYFLKISDGTTGFLDAYTLKDTSIKSKNSVSFLTISSTLSVCTTLWSYCLAVSTWGTNLPFFQIIVQNLLHDGFRNPWVFSIIPQPTQQSSQELLLEPHSHPFSLPLTCHFASHHKAEYMLANMMFV